MLKEGYTNLFDIACGYTPRSIYCARAGIDYVGVDVPVVAEELERLAQKIGLSQKHPTYMGADATNAASLTAAASLLQGAVLISCEGLALYLYAEEFEQLLGGIREVLLQHGGTWITSDMGVDYEAFATTCMSDPDAVKLYRKAKKAAMSSSNVYEDGVTFWDEGRKQAFIEAHGFRVEKVPFYDGDEDLATLRDIPETWKNALKMKLNESRLWVMTVDEDFKGSQMIEGAKQVENLSIDYTKKGGVLQCRVNGRIDTISAPALLEIFETNYDDTASIMVDAGKLEYISSAGLRVLLMAVKKLGTDSVTVCNTSDAVKEIFETTGFDQLITVR
jgi:anti-anti-sigma factor